MKKYQDIEKWAKIYKDTFVNEASHDEAIQYHRAYLELGKYFASYIAKADAIKHKNDDVNEISSRGNYMCYVDAIFALAEYILSKPDAEDWQKEVAKQVSQLGAGYMI